ncbi:hypothetical protein AURDEDRAFT_177372 [Auricularia subglabra TFB-10046 SS5]|uniref:Uncharacterized protein n=1 Tax=Auricularia subglabra (strain TFB-10046 / SS5) TaxID=717982 RepID=J0WMH2_AURST|nr:hypothetical protein AURDEDRAFT_177372 [Auricularia subglabra TFB-10046 SS5]
MENALQLELASAAAALPLSTGNPPQSAASVSHTAEPRSIENWLAFNAPVEGGTQLAGVSAGHALAATSGSNGLTGYAQSVPTSTNQAGTILHQYALPFVSGMKSVEYCVTTSCEISGKVVGTTMTVTRSEENKGMEESE